MMKMIEPSTNLTDSVKVSSVRLINDLVNYRHEQLCNEYEDYAYPCVDVILKEVKHIKDCKYTVTLNVSIAYYERYFQRYHLETREETYTIDTDTGAFDIVSSNLL